MTGQAVVITGGASGIGLAAARRFAATGYRVALADLESPRLDRAAETVAELGAEVVAVPTDVSDPGSVNALADTVARSFGDVDIVMNNAGVAPAGSVVEATPELWQWIMSVNVLGVAYGIGAFAPAMRARGRGHIINTASEAGLATSGLLGAYAASKHAVVGMSEAAFRELEPHGVAVSVVCPALVATNIGDAHSYSLDRFGTLEPPSGSNPMAEAATALGISPEVVADHVFDAVATRRFWVLTHPATRQRAVQRFEDLLEDRNPTNAYELG